MNEIKWKSGEEVFAWWMNEDINQITIDDWIGGSQ
jgi:hypothetical protein